jgi:hypothetical protein
MEKFENLLPRHKCDFDRVEKIKSMDRNKILPLLPGLLEWTKDMNWPIAPSVMELLLTFPKEIVPHVQEALSSNDDNWKYFILKFLVCELPIESRVLFKHYLSRLAKTPTPNEVAEELDEIALEILETV